MAKRVKSHYRKGHYRKSRSGKKVWIPGTRINSFVRGKAKAVKRSWDRASVGSEAVRQAEGLISRGVSLRLLPPRGQAPIPEATMVVRAAGAVCLSSSLFWEVFQVLLKETRGLVFR